MGSSQCTFLRIEVCQETDFFVVCGVYVRHQILASQGNTLASCNKLHVPWLGPKKNQVVCVPSNYITLANMKQIVRKIWSCGHSEINVRNGRLQVVVSVLLKLIWTASTTPKCHRNPFWYHQKPIEFNFSQFRKVPKVAPFVTSCASVCNAMGSWLPWADQIAPPGWEHWSQTP